MGASIKIISGPLKSNVGEVKSVMDDILRVQLHSNGDTIMIYRSHVAEISKRTGSFINKSPFPEATATKPIPNIDGKDGSGTSLHGPQTPMYESKYPHLCSYVYLLLTSKIVYEIVYEGSWIGANNVATLVADLNQSTMFMLQVLALELRTIREHPVTMVPKRLDNREHGIQWFPTLRERITTTTIPVRKRVERLNVILKFILRMKINAVLKISHSSMYLDIISLEDHPVHKLPSPIQNTVRLLCISRL